MQHPYYPPYYGKPAGIQIKTVLIITVVIIALIVGIYIYAQAKAKSAIESQLPAQYTTDGTYSVTESNQIRVLSESIKDDLAGLNIFGHNTDLYNQLMKWPDKLFVGFCIDFQRINGGVSFRKAFTDDSWSFQLANPFSLNYDDVVAKLNALSIV